MYLKRIEIKGFKSFADNTELILQPGINVIAGPNGCGKSNIVDAVRWCLGESNIRHLRGQKGEDVIFNGTDNKRALGMAMVELSIENGDGILPLDYDEVHIIRKLFRSGESEYYINKSRVRMKDIYGLFAGTGLGRKGYSIVSQGELEQVLSGHALDRRFILEEASGIIKYRQQRDEVRNRLLSTGQDLTRLKDILVELKQGLGLFLEHQLFHQFAKGRMKGPGKNHTLFPQFFRRMQSHTDNLYVLLLKVHKHPGTDSNRFMQLKGLIMARLIHVG